MQGKWINQPGSDTSIIFVHGILSSGETCWRHANGSYWPEILKESEGFDSLGIYVFTYHTSIFSGNYRLGDVVDALKEYLKLDGVLKSKQIIFVCHSMGGIVVRKFLVERATELLDLNLEIGLFFLASPSLGSSYANWLSPLAKILGHTQADALRFEQNNAWLNDLDKEFQNLKEAGKLRLKGKELVEDSFILLKKFWRKQVVEPFSGARYFGEPFKVPNSGHFSIAKPESMDAVQHRLLCQFVHSFSGFSLNHNFYRLGSEAFIDNDTALRDARSILGGSIDRAISFRNFNSERQYLAVARKANDEEHNSTIHILERVGGTYTQLWVSDELWGFDPATLQVIDIDRDGVKEVAFMQESFGSGAGTKCLFVYSMKKQQLFTVTEFYNYSDASSPGAYPIIEAGDNLEFRGLLIEYAHSQGLLQSNESVDFDDPRFATKRWHKENGEKRSGNINLCLFEGKPIYGASVADTLDTGQIEWSAYFKGPLYGYIKSTNQHFIAYSPQWVYEWPKSIAHDGNNLWFVCHCIPGLFSFSYESCTLNRYCAYLGKPLPDIEVILFEDGRLSCPELELAIDTKYLEMCRGFCKLNEPHLPNACDYNKYPSVHFSAE